MNRRELRTEIITRFIKNLRAGREVSYQVLVEEVLKDWGYQLSTEDKTLLLSEICENIKRSYEHMEKIRLRAAGSLRVDSAPGFRLRRVAQFLFSPKVFAKSLNPLSGISLTNTAQLWPINTHGRRVGSVSGVTGLSGPPSSPKCLSRFSSWYTGSGKRFRRELPRAESLSTRGYPF